MALAGLRCPSLILPRPLWPLLPIADSRWPSLPWTALDGRRSPLLALPRSSPFLALAARYLLLALSSPCALFRDLAGLHCPVHALAGPCWHSLRPASPRSSLAFDYPR